MTFPYLDRIWDQKFQITQFWCPEGGETSYSKQRCIIAECDRLKSQVKARVYLKTHVPSLTSEWNNRFLQIIANIPLWKVHRLCVLRYVLWCLLSFHAVWDFCESAWVTKMFTFEQRFSCNHDSLPTNAHLSLVMFSRVWTALYGLTLPMSHWDSNLLRQAMFPPSSPQTLRGHRVAAPDGAAPPQRTHTHTHTAKFSCLLSVQASGDRQHTWGWGRGSQTTFLNLCLNTPVWICWTVTFQDVDYRLNNCKKSISFSVFHQHFIHYLTKLSHQLWPVNHKVTSSWYQSFSR